MLEFLVHSTTCKHPVVMLAGIQAADLEALLEFVYKGEVSIDPNQLPSLLQAAHCLNIQGLAPASNCISSSDTSSHSSRLDYGKTHDVIHEVQTPNQQIQTYQDAEIPIKRKKRAKRLLKSPTIPTNVNKWPKLYIQPEGNENVLISGQDDSSSSWTHHMNIVNVSTSTSVDSIPIQTPILVQNIPVTISNSSTSNPKVRGASDQPGACPLCGALLRQARNLRRHLITSCKYRMVNGTHPTTSSAVSSPTQAERMPEGQLHQLQTITLQNADRITQSTLERLENKPIALTPISCTELIPSSSNLISMQTSPMQ